MVRLVVDFVRALTKALAGLVSFTVTVLTFPLFTEIGAVPNRNVVFFDARLENLSLRLLILLIASFFSLA